MKFAAVQMNSTDCVEDNLLLVKTLITEAKEQGASIVLLPENFAFMGYPKQMVEEIMEDFEDGPIQSAISDLANQLDIWIIHLKL
jgi:nitrilase